jgi:two-component sensor histidine kinase
VNLGKMGVMTSAPHATAVELHAWRLDSFAQLRKLRAALREAVVEEPAVVSPDVDLGDVFDRMAVVATELATNALRHGLPPTVVRLLREDDHLILDVADHDLQAQPRLDVNRPLGAGGLGLQLTRTFAIDVGWYITADTKHVWASFPG